MPNVVAAPCSGLGPGDRMGRHTEKDLNFHSCLLVVDNQLNTRSTSTRSDLLGACNSTRPNTTTMSDMHLAWIPGRADAARVQGTPATARLPQTTVALPQNRGARLSITPSHTHTSDDKGTSQCL
ncbi:hypothetical protein VTO42DRAFT_6077 [Malbranchea cinnamomea]